MRQFHIFNFAILVAAILAWPSTGRAQAVTTLTDPYYVAVLQDITKPSVPGPCGPSGANNYSVCSGGGIPLGYFATAASVNSRFADAFGQLAVLQQSGLQVQAQLAGLQQSALQAQAQLADLQHSALQAQRGISAVAAMANSWMPSAPGKTSWAVNGATFQGEFGAGFSVAHRLPTNVPLAVTAAYGNGGGSAHVGRVGLMGEF
jgi:hypothetical protein